MATFHRYLGFALVTTFLVIALSGVILRLLRRDEAPRALWGLQHYTENFLVLQSVIGVVFLLLGRRWIVGLTKEIEREADLPPPPVSARIKDPTDDSEALPDSEPPPKV